MKPTYGAVSRFGLVAFASSMDQIGPLTKDVTDCAMVLNAITGYDPMDSTSADVKYPDYSKALINDVKGIRIGIPKEYIGDNTNLDVKKAVLDAAKTLKELGAQVAECSLPLTEYAIPAYYIIIRRNKVWIQSKRIYRFDGLVRKNKERRFRCRGKEKAYALSSGYYDQYYKKALQVRTLIKNAFNEVFEKYDVLLGPAAPTTAFKIGEKKEKPLEMYLGDIYTVSVNIAGLPALTIPCGFDGNNLPIGLQLIGKPFDESTLLRVGYTFEQNTEFHKKRAGI